MNVKRFLIFMGILVITLSMSACSGNEDKDRSASVSSADEQEVINQLAKEAEAVPEPDTQTNVGIASSTESSSANTEDKLLGEWADVNDAARIVKITVNGAEYQYSDSDGTYTGMVKDNILTIKISDADNDTAQVFIDSKTGNLVTNYQGDIYEFTRKLQ